MNILVISPSSHKESVGGIERYILNLIDYCKGQEDLKVWILLPAFGDECVEVEGNVTMIYTHDTAIVKDMSAVEVTEGARAFADNIEKIIKQEHIDVICAENTHLGFPPAYNILLNMISVIHNVPVLLRLHSFATTELQKELINQLMWQRVSCVSVSVAGDCFSKGADVDTLSTDYLGVNTKEFIATPSDGQIREKLGLKPEHKVILTASRIINEKKNILEEKGIINLIESFSKISSRYPDLRLVIAVAKPPQSLDGEFKIAMEMIDGYIKLYKVADQTIVHVFGLDEMPQVYREADMFVLASQNETFGQVFIEAMACGVPVIGTKVGGIPEIISDNYNGFLIIPDDASALRQRIETLLNNPSLRNDFIKSGTKTVRDKFTLEKQFARFIELLKKMVRDSKPNGSS